MILKQAEINAHATTYLVIVKSQITMCFFHWSFFTHVIFVSLGCSAQAVTT